MISIIVPVYNVESYLEICIQSIVNQFYKDWELLLVDDGSPDSCPQICDLWATKDKRIKVFHKKNGGLSSARNYALNYVRGEFVVFVDSDDFLHSTYLSTMHSIMESENADIVQCGYVTGSETVFPNISENLKPQIRTFDNHSIFLSGSATTIVWDKMYKRSLLKDITFPEGKINEDTFTTWKFYFRASKIVLINNPLYYYTQNKTGIMSKQKTLPRIDFVDAYHERITFFKEKSITDLEIQSRIQFCKSIIIQLSKLKCSVDIISILKEEFKSNYILVKKSEQLPKGLKMLFVFFNYCPNIVRSIIKHL